MAELQEISSLKEGVLAKNPQLKNTCFKSLLSLAREQPESLYPEWEFFAGLIEPERWADTKYVGLYILAGLTSVDTEGKFTRVLDKFYALLDDKSLIPSAHAALMSGQIARNIPSLTGVITERLLKIDDTHHPKGRRELIKSYVIQAIEEYWQSLDNDQRRRVFDFITNQQNSASPKKAKLARQFLKMHPAV